jgi:hypothetical protein
VSNKEVPVSDFIGSCEATLTYAKRRDALLTSSLAFCILAITLWLIVIVMRVCCWKYVVKNKLATHHHFHHREKMALALITHQHDNGLVAGDNSPLSRWKRAARKVAVTEQIHHTRVFLSDRQKHKSFGKKSIEFVKHLQKWWAHNFSLSLTFEGDSTHSGRLYGAKTMVRRWEGKGEGGGEVRERGRLRDVMCLPWYFVRFDLCVCALSPPCSFPPI